MDAPSMKCVISRFGNKFEFEHNVEALALRYIQNEVCFLNEAFLSNIKKVECVCGLVSIANDEDFKWGYYTIENWNFQTNVSELHGFVNDNFPNMSTTYNSADGISKNVAQQFEHIKFYFDPKISSSFDNTVVAVGLNYDFKLISTLERIVNSVESAINNDKKYCLSKEKLICLAKTLNKRNFQNRNKSGTDVLRKIIEIIRILKDRGQHLEDANEHLEQYFENNRSKYINDIKTFSEKLKNDKNLIEILKLAIQKRVLFLKDFATLCPEKIAIEDIGSLLELVLLDEDINALIKAKNDTLAKITSFDEEISDINNAEAVDRISKMMLHIELAGIKKQIVYLKNMCLLSIESDLFEVLPLLEHCQYKVDDESNARLLDKLLLLGKRMQNETIAITTIWMVLKIGKPFDLSKIEDSIFKCLNQDYIREVLQLTSIVSNFNSHHEELFKFLGKVLVESPTKTLRTQALTILLKFSQLPNDVKNLTELEKKIMEEKYPMNVCLHYIKELNNKLTYAAFDYMQEHFSHKDVPEIIQLLVQKEQKIPDTFVCAFKRFLQNHKPNKNLFTICRSLIVGNYLQLEDVSLFFEKILVAKEPYTDDLILTISSLIQKGENLSANLLQHIKSACDSSKVATNIIMQSSPNYSLFNTIRNPRVQLHQKLNCLETIKKSESNNDLYTLEMLLITYCNEPGLRNHIFNHFLTLYKNGVYITMGLINKAFGFSGSKTYIINSKNYDSKTNRIDWNLISTIVLNRKIFVSKTDFSEVLNIIETHEEPNIINFLDFLQKLAAKNEKYIWYLMLSLRKFIFRKDMILKWENPWKNDLLGVIERLDDDKKLFNKIPNDQPDKIDVNYKTKTNRISAFKKRLPALSDAVAISDFLFANNDLIDQTLFEFVLTTVMENNFVLVNQNFYYFLAQGNFIIPENFISKMVRFLFTEIDSKFKLLILNTLQNAKVSHEAYQKMEIFLYDIVLNDLLMSPLLLNILFANCSDEKSKQNLLQKYSSKLLLFCDHVRTRIQLFLNNYCDTLEKLNFLIDLTHYIRRIDKDTSILIKLIEFPEKTWYTELLISTILFDIQSLQNYDLYNLCFLENLQNLCNFAIKNGVNQNEILNKLIRKINFETDLQYINSFITWLQTNTDCLQLDFVKDKIKVKKYWLKTLINSCKMKCSEKYQFENLFQLLHAYQGHVVENMFCKLKSCSDLNINQLLKLFSILDMIVTKQCRKEDFMFNLNCQSLDEMLKLLYEFVVDVISQNISMPNLYVHKKKLAKLLYLDWEINSLVRILLKRNNISTEEATSFGYTLDIVVDYQLRGYEEDLTGSSLQKILEEEPIQSLNKRVHDFAIHKIFHGTYDKTVAELVDEIQSLNNDVAADILKNTSLITYYKNVMDFMNQKSQILPNLDCIATWKAGDIKNWSRELSSAVSNNLSEIEKLAVILRAVRICKSYALRAIQTLALICLVNSENKGRLCQINTGEGKTTIIAAFAIFKALEKRKVDIITSSSELAIPQSNEQRELYSLFNLSVEHNGYSKGYTADILYGAASDFQGDVLRDEFSQIGTLLGRKSEVAIVDEVDSMLIDGKNHIVMLASVMPMMNHTQTLLAVIYKQVQLAALSLVEKDGVVYYVNPKDRIDSNGKLNVDIVEQAYPINMPKQDFIKQCVDRHLRQILRDEQSKDSHSKLHLPVHLRELVLSKQLTKWTDRAIIAMFKYEEGKHYILKDNKIKPVDALNTGVVQSNMSWSFGLHEFLEIKHGCKMSVERITTNFLSNVSFFKRYGKQIYGLTGTLGGTAAQRLLEDTYLVDSLVIPPFRSKQFYQMPPLLCSDEESWLQTIVATCLNHLRHKRAVLVITRYIKQVEDIVSLLKMQHDENKIKEYKTQADSAVVQSTLEAGEIIVATNIAGRGTDIKPSPIVQENGGLHVCITFIPQNERVEVQNIGRTSRTGNQGTSQNVVLSKDKTYDVLLMERNCDEELKLTNAKAEINKVLRKDNIFKEFCQYLKEVRSHNTIKFIDTYIHSIEEQFGIWLLQKEEAITKGELSTSEAIADFKRHVNFNLNTPESSIKNVAFLVLLGNRYLHIEDFGMAQFYYSKAIALDPNFSHNAYYSRGYARIAEFGESINDKKDEASEKNKVEVRNAIEDLKKSRDLINDRITELHLIQEASSGKVFSEQVIHKITLYNCQKQIIDEAIGIDVDQRNKEIDRLNSLKKQLNGKLENEEGDKEMMENIDIQIKNFREEIDQQGNGGVIGTGLGKCNELTIKLQEINKMLPESEENSLYNDEINELKVNGFIGPFEVEAKKPIPWRDVITLAIIGLVQMTAGVALIVYSVGSGASIGITLLSEGILDIVTAVKDGIINRNFSWSTWGIQKAIVLTVSIAFAGLAAIKDVANTIVGGVSAIGSQMSTGTNIGWKLAAKCMGIALAKEVGKKVLSAFAEYGIQKCILNVIDKEIERLVEIPIQVALQQNKNVKMMLELDSKNRNNHYQAEIIRIADSILDGNKIVNKIIKIGENVFGRIIKNIKNKNSEISQIYNTLDMIKQLDMATDLMAFVPHFILKLNQDIEKFAKKHKIEEKYEALKLSSSETHTPINNTNETVSDNDIDLDKASKMEKQATQTDMLVDPMKVSNAIAKGVSLKMTAMIKDIIMPVINSNISISIDSMTSSIDKSIKDQLGDYKAMRRIEFIQDGDGNGRVPSEFRRGMEDTGSIQKANDMIEDVRNGGELGLPHLGAVSDACDHPIKVYDENGSYVRTIGSDKPGTPIEVQYHPPCEDRNGHFTKINNIEATRTSSGPNDCLFNVISDHTGQSPQELRDSTAQNMEARIHDYANQAKDVMRLEQSNLSFLQYGGNNRTDAHKIENNSHGTLGHGYLNKNHPKAYVSSRDLPKQVKDEKVKNLQNFSKNSKPFQNQIPDNFFTHIQNVQERNAEFDQETVTLIIENLGITKKNYCGVWENGEERKKIDMITSFLQHHKGQKHNKN